MTIQSNSKRGGRRAGAGAPPNNKNALKSGKYSRDKKTERRDFNRLMKHYRETLQTINMS